jgi:DNA polymerase III subunit gamma/tau
VTELFAQTLTDDIDQPPLFPETATESPPHYRVLARKYRPTTFEQLIGQEAMVRTLTNAIESGRLPHAWMLTGVRGIGKTTTARIIARALNCTGLDGTGGPTINPCGQCNSCKTIAEDRHVDVLEMDAASRTGVDDIRDIIDGVRYGPVAARYKIYILDEVHMLSKNAFNALLKTLEEPPPHTKFIFATTEIRRVPITVLSRCQRFDLRRISSETLAKHYADVLKLEKAIAEPEAVKLIAHAADGSVRDGLSLLDQAMARGNGHVTTSDVKDMLGLADRAHILTLCRTVMRGEMVGALETFETMQQAGSDALQILQDMCDLVHLLTRGQVIPAFAQDKNLAEYDRQLLKDLADITVPALARAWQILLKGIGEVQQAFHPSQAAEMVLIRLAYAAELPPPADLIKQLRTTTSGPMVSTPPPTSPHGAGSRAVLTSTGAGSAPARQSFPHAETIAQASPRNYRELVELFATNREGALHAQLYSNVNPIHCAPGVLEIHVGSDAPADLAGRLTQCLLSWTGQRWVISISGREGEPSLAAQDHAAEQKRKETIMSHPLVKTTMKTFPGAKIIALRQKTVEPLPVPLDETPLIDPED